MTDPNAFNLGRGMTFQFGDQPRLMQSDIRLLLRESEGVIIVAVDRPQRLGLTSKDFAVQWRRDGLPIPGETGRAYTKRLEDRGHTIDCVVTDALALTSEKVNV